MSESRARQVDLQLDGDGFLKTMSSWTRSMAVEVAERNGIGPLTDDHWKVIAFVRSSYQTYRTGPPVVKIARHTGLSAAQICRLFPCGVVKGAYRLAGLPRPAGCA
ncbi:MAG TPA: TusE/DsrC/DsvC family sulfur relay protein [Planctomycetaceae bacterium]|nr:TusE/DsrC/DsvC family sulfur relay protein [Planctomycetaceae bacterium]HIQ23317.1 TusE/DsrC/DsvC family sulfur relay protein [Planctomycetota bacterium]